jgi:hypothetical protein
MEGVIDKHLICDSSIENNVYSLYCISTGIAKWGRGMILGMVVRYNLG